MVDPDAPGTDLPVPYEAPARLLARDLQAVLASWRLKLQELWRRNREGDLPAPRLWPASLRALFWPLVVVASLALVMALAPLAFRLGDRPDPGGAAAVAPVPQAAPEPEPAPLPGPESLPAPESLPESLSEPEQESEQEQVPDLPPPLLAPRLEDQLREAFNAADPEPLVVRVDPEPAASLLRLFLANSFRQLPEPRRQLLAERWQQQASSLGYERLELQDQQARLLGRTALVGQGMVLLDGRLDP